MKTDLRNSEMTDAYELINRWFREIGCGANDPLYLNIEPERCYIADAAGEMTTLANDWDVMACAPTLVELAELLKSDLS